MDSETPVTDDYKEGDNKFTGKIHKVIVEVGPLKIGAADQEELRQDAAQNEGCGVAVVVFMIREELSGVGWVEG